MINYYVITVILKINHLVIKLLHNVKANIKIIKSIVKDFELIKVYLQEFNKKS